MKTRLFLSTIILIVCAIDTYAQTSITSKHNGYRDGDVLYRIISDKTLPGDSGKECVWTLPKTPDNDKIFKQTISLKNDSLTIAEGELLLHYIATDKELSMCGFQNRGIYGVQDKVLPELIYPFTYGDSISDTFSRATTYYDLFTIKGEGTCYTVCDGWGVLTDGEEILDNVLRIHHHNTIVSVTKDENDKDLVSEVTEDKYLWYYPGCRYPVMDTRMLTSKSNGEVVSDSIFTSLYLPELQISELAYDEANSEIRENKDEYEDISATDIKAVLQAGKREILLEYFTEGGTHDVTFYAYDIAGRVLGKVTHTSPERGQQHDIISLTQKPINDILMLQIVAGNKQYTVKVR